MINYSNDWKSNNTYDYVAVEDWNSIDENDVRKIIWKDVVFSEKGFFDSWKIFVGISSESIKDKKNLFIVFQVTSFENNSFRIRLDRGAKSPDFYKDKEYGPIVKKGLEANAAREKKRGSSPSFSWGLNGFIVGLKNYNVLFTKDDNDFLSVYAIDIANNNKINIISGENFHSSCSISTGIDVTRIAPSATHYFGFGDILNYNEGEGPYEFTGFSNINHIGNMVTCFNYDNLWYNQPEIFGDKASYKNSFKGKSSIPQYMNIPLYIERNTINDDGNIFLGVFLDNPSQTFFSLKYNNSDVVKMGVQFGEIDSHYVLSDKMSGAINGLTKLTSTNKKLGCRALMPPKYIFGYFQAKYGCLGLLSNKENKKNSIENIVKNYKEHDFPLEGIGVDIDVQKDKNIFTINNNFWGKDDSGEEISVFEWLRRRNLQSHTNITPFVRADIDSYETDGEMKNSLAGKLIYNDLCIMNEGEANIKKFKGPKDVEKYPLLTYMKYKNNNYPDQNLVVLDYGINKKTGMRDKIGAIVPDFGKKDSAELWGKQYSYLFRNGLGFVWQDMTVPDTMPHVEDGQNFADTMSERSQYAWSTSGELSIDNRRKTNTFNWRSLHGQLQITDPRFLGKKTAFSKLRNFYSYMLSKATYEYGIEKNRDDLISYKRSFVICRSGYFGSQHYSGHWIGDNASTWHHLQVAISQVLSLGVSGIPISGADVGGFAPGEDSSNVSRVFYHSGKYRSHNPMVYDRLALKLDDVDNGESCEPELMTRWVQAACLQPWMRNHYDAMKSSQELYSYNEFANKEKNIYFKDIMKIFLDLRLKWHHLLYDSMYENTLTGNPINKTMYLWEGDNNIFDCDKIKYMSSQFFISDCVIVAPIVNKSLKGKYKSYYSKRNVYLPKQNGNNIIWYGYDVAKGMVDPRKKYLGGKTYKVGASIAESNIFLREGAVIPERYLVNTTENEFNNIQNMDKNREPLVFYIVPSDKNNKYTFFWDDGGVTTNAEQENLYTRIVVRHIIEKNKIIFYLDIEKCDFKINVDVFFRIYFNEEKNAYVDYFSLDKGVSIVTPPKFFVKENAKNENYDIWLKLDAGVIENVGELFFQVDF